MVLGIIAVATSIPLIASSALSLQDNAQNQQAGNGPAALKSDKASISVRATARMSGERRRLVDGCGLVLANQKLYIDHGSYALHRFAGYFLAYPGQAHDGLVSTINSENMLNWIYVDRDTHEAKYGVREEAERHLTGPMGLVNRTAMKAVGPAQPDDSAVEHRYTFNGWEGFVLVEEVENAWALYFDLDDDGLKGKVEGKRVTEVELCRQPMALPLR